MYLKFHNVDHADVVLHEGMIVLGSSPECHVMLQGKGVESRHCRIDVHEGKAILRPMSDDATCVLNGRRVEDASPLAAGDLLLLGQVGCQVIMKRAGQQDTSRSRTPRPSPAAVAAGHGQRAPLERATHVRGALPRLVLRGLSGPVLGRSFPLRDGMLLGRSRECDVFIESQEISRQHARLRVRPDSVLVEDLASTNGTFVNDERVTTAPVQPGDELRLDTVRFVMVAPGSPGRPAPSGQDEDAGTHRPWRSVAMLVILLVLLVLAWWTWR